MEISMGRKRWWRESIVEMAKGQLNIENRSSGESPGLRGNNVKPSRYWYIGQ